MRPVQALVVVVATVAATSMSHAAPPVRAFSVELDAVAEVETWRAQALRALIAREAAQDRRLELADEASQAPDAAPPLVLGGTIHRAHVDLWIRGANQPARARIATTDTDPRTLRRALRAMLDDALSPIDAGTATIVPAVVSADGASAAVVILWLILLLVLAVPFAAGAWLLGRGHGTRIARSRSFRYATLIAGGGLLACIVAVVLGDGVAGASAPILIAGGLAWGWFAVVNIRTVFPAFPGFEQVEHGDVFRLTRAWSLVALQRLVRAVAFYTPFALLLWLGCILADVSAGVALALLAPAWGLIARFWLLALVDLASLYLDRELVPGQPTDEDPWHTVVRGYFMGYVRRVGWPADDDLLDDILFLPGRSDELILYGGGLTHARIIIGKDILEYALAPYGRPHDYAGPRISKLHWSEWNAGLVVPVELEGKLATAEERQPRHATVPGETDWEPLGQPPTLAGFVEPDQFDKRDAHRPEADPLWLDWDAGDEHDGTDASDKDFVFGALVRELGAIQRRDHELATLHLAFRRRLETGPGFARRAYDRAGQWIRRGFSRYPAIIGDAYAALNYARHHLMQYLAWRAWGDEDMLTARAYAPELERQSGLILRELDKRAAAEGGAAEGTDTSRRMAWLSEFFRPPVHSRRMVLARRIAFASALLAFVVVCAIGIKRAVDYHPTFVDRIETQPQVQGSENEQD